MKKRTLVLIDGHALLFRAYYGIPYLTSPDGRMVNAVYGFTSTILSVIAELSPTHIAVSFDMEGPTFRKEEFEAYKANRSVPPDDLIPQFELAHEMTRALNVPIFEKKGFEADDVIGTLAEQAKKKKYVKTMIVTGDRDSFQLIEDEKVLVYVPGRRSKPSKVYGEEEVVDSMGIRADQMVDLKGLAGDASDNIPGIKGIGPKTAVSLITKFGSIEEIYEAFDRGDVDGEIGKAMLVKLKDGREMALKSKKLATIVRDVPVKLKLSDCRVHGYDKEKTFELLDELGFKSLVTRLPKDEFEMSVQEALF